MGMRSGLDALALRLAAPAGAVVRFFATAGQGLAGVGLVSFGAWLAWPPAGWMCAGVLLLADVAYDRIMKGGRAE